jgi:hypothetical protein
MALMMAMSEDIRETREKENSRKVGKNSLVSPKSTLHGDVPIWI